MNDIESLQEKISYQERTIEQLNDALVNQQLQIERLKKELRLLTGAIKALREESRSGDVESDAANLEYEIPPHY